VAGVLQTGNTDLPVPEGVEGDDLSMALDYLAINHDPSRFTFEGPTGMVRRLRHLAWLKTLDIVELAVKFVEDKMSKANGGRVGFALLPGYSMYSSKLKRLNESTFDSVQETTSFGHAWCSSHNKIQLSSSRMLST
jgi:hypothetical protein